MCQLLCSSLREVRNKIPGLPYAGGAGAWDVTPAQYSQMTGFDFLGNLKGMGPLQMLGTAYGLGDVGYNMFTPNRSLYWGPQALTTAAEGAMTGFSLTGGNPIGAAVGGLTGYVGGKF